MSSVVSSHQDLGFYIWRLFPNDSLEKAGSGLVENKTHLCHI